MDWERVEGISGVQKINALCFDLGGGYMEIDKQTDRDDLQCTLKTSPSLALYWRETRLQKQQGWMVKEKRGGSQQKEAENETEIEVGEQHEVRTTLPQYESEAQGDGELRRDQQGLPSVLYLLQGSKASPQGIVLSQKSFYLFLRVCTLDGHLAPPPQQVRVGPEQDSQERTRTDGHTHTGTTIRESRMPGALLAFTIYTCVTALPSSPISLSPPE